MSANLVSQLPLVPLRQMDKRWPGSDLPAYGRAIVAAHLNHLRGFDCPTLLVGDVQRRVDEGGLRRGSPPSGAGAHAWQLDQLTASGMTQSSHASTKPPCCEPDVLAASW